MVNVKDYNICDILPHDYPMILIDDIISVNLEEKTAECEVKINDTVITQLSDVQVISEVKERK